MGPSAPQEGSGGTMARLEVVEVPEGAGVYVLADGKVNILASAQNLRQALQELAAAPPGALQELATHLWVEATPEPERRRAELIGALRAQIGAFPPCNRRHPRSPARLAAWWDCPEGDHAVPATTVNVSSMGPARPAQTSQKRQYARFQAFLPAQCRVQGPQGEPLELEGKTGNLGEGGVLLLLPRTLPEGVPLTIELDTQTGPAARGGRVAWVGKPEPTDLGGTVIPHGIAFGHALERAFVEAVVIQRPLQDPRAAVEVQVDYGTVVSGRSVNLSRSGLFLRTAHPLPVNRALTLRFSLPGVAEPFHVQGKVIWSNPKPGKIYPQGIGVKFVDLPGERADQIEAFVAQVRREGGVERITDLFGRPQEELA